MLTRVGELSLAPVTVAPEHPGGGQGGGEGYLAAVDEAGLPVGLGPARDGVDGLGQVAVIPGTLGIGELLTPGTLALLRLNPYGALVTDADGAAVGVLERATVDALLRGYGTMEHEVRGEGPTPGDAVLAGTVSTPLAKVTCRCGRSVVLSSYDPEYPPSCPGLPDGRVANPHPLELTGF